MHMHIRTSVHAVLHACMHMHMHPTCMRMLCMCLCTLCICICMCMVCMCMVCMVCMVCMSTCTCTCHVHGVHVHVACACEHVTCACASAFEFACACACACACQHVQVRELQHIFRNSFVCIRRFRASDCRLLPLVLYIFAYDIIRVPWTADCTFLCVPWLQLRSVLGDVSP